MTGRDETDPRYVRFIELRQVADQAFDKGVSPHSNRWLKWWSSGLSRSEEVKSPNLDRTSCIEETKTEGVLAHILSVG